MLHHRFEDLGCDRGASPAVEYRISRYQVHRSTAKVDIRWRWANLGSNMQGEDTTYTALANLVEQINRMPGPKTSTSRDQRLPHFLRS